MKTLCLLAVLGTLTQLANQPSLRAGDWVGNGWTKSPALAGGLGIGPDSGKRYLIAGELGNGRSLDGSVSGDWGDGRA